MSRDYENTCPECTPIESQFNMLSSSTNELRNLWEDLETRLTNILTPLEIAPPENKKASEDALSNISSLATDLRSLRYIIDKLRADMSKTFDRIEL